MSQSPRFAPTHSKPHILEIFTTHISDNDFHLISHGLTRIYQHFIEVQTGGELDIPPHTYHPQRNQFNADLLVRYLLTQKKDEMALWIFPQDLYTHNMNFIFGLAYYYQGAVLSLYRLSTDDLKEKEAIHETGHILGLPHCPYPCVIHYSNSLWDAQEKPLELCDHCRRTLNI